MSGSVDPLFPVMVMCKESEGAISDPSSRFVRMVCNNPEPMTVLAFDWSLADLERFCTNPQHHVILSVDPTFNLGSFQVTVTTYQHPMLEYVCSPAQDVYHVQFFLFSVGWFEAPSTGHTVFWY